MSVTKDEVKYIAQLARLKFTEEELGNMTSEMDAILEFANTLNAIDTDGVPPMEHVLPVENVFRDSNEAKVFPAIADAIAAAPDGQDNYFTVPKVVE